VDVKREHERRVMDSIENGLFKLKEITNLTSSTDASRAKPQTYADLMGDDKLIYEADIDAMNWILLGIPNDIYNFVDACQDAQAMWKRVQRLMQGNDLKDKLSTTMMLLARAITQHLWTPTDNRLHTSSNMRNQALQDGQVDIQGKSSGFDESSSRNARNKGRNSRNQGITARNAKNVQRNL
nr:hypothetical protein [Tanacetum cinerariifolium]